MQNLQFWETQSKANISSKKPATGAKNGHAVVPKLKQESSDSSDSDSSSEEETMGKSNMSNTQEESYDKAYWEKEQIDIFCSLCVQCIEVGHLKNTHLFEEGWDLIMGEFPKLAGKRYSKKQMKNKWDSLKIDWKLWKQLKVSATGLGWDLSKKTINAPQSWWLEITEGNPKLLKFKKNGIDPELESTLDRMFMKTVATGEFAWAPSCGTLPSDSVNEGTSALRVDSDSDSDDASLGAQVNKRKQISEAQATRPKKRKFGSAQHMSSCFERLVGAIDSRNAKSVASVGNESVVPSIANVIGQMDEIDELSEVDPSGMLYMFALDLFENKTKREIFSSLKTNQKKIQWLQLQKEKDANKL